MAATALARAAAAAGPLALRSAARSAVRATAPVRLNHGLQPAPSPLRRALLYLPGDDERKAQKAAGLNVDCVCLDLEDAVALNRKDDARSMVCELLKSTDFGSSDVAVRINPLMTDLALEDLKALFSNGACPQTLVVPKVDTPEQMLWLFDNVERICGKLPDPAEQCKVLIQVESPTGLLNLKEIIQMDEQEATESFVLDLDGLIFGSDDFAASVGATRTEAAHELLFARQSVVTHAKAFGLQAIDMVNINYKDLKHLRQECIEGAAMGFTGKQIIHPNQIDVVQDAFSPSDERIQYALELEAAFNEHQRQGKGAFTFRDQMIDMPTMHQCQNVLALARRIGKAPPQAPADESDADATTPDAK